MRGTDASRINELVSHLAQPDRYIVLLFYADDLTPQEIALVLDQPIRVVHEALDEFRGHAAAVLDHGRDEAESLENPGPADATEPLRRSA